MIPIELTLPDGIAVLVNPDRIEYVFRSVDETRTHVCFPGENNIMYVLERIGEVHALLERAARHQPGPLSPQSAGKPPAGPATDAGHGSPAGGATSRVCRACLSRWAAPVRSCPECGLPWLPWSPNEGFAFSEPRSPETRRERLDRVIGEAVGAASVCWESPEGAGVFQSELATVIIDALRAEVYRFSRLSPTRTSIDRAADVIHEQTCRDNQHDGPEAEWPCVSLATEALKRVHHG